jgi:surfeit locus 1 family protein
MHRYKPGRFHFNWKLTLTVLLFFPILLRLGFWQLAREDEKQQLQDLYEARLQQIPQELTEISAYEDLHYMPVRVNGNYDNSRMFLLDNRTWRGQVGYELIVPLTLDDGNVAFVNRGWLALGNDRSVLPQPEFIEGPVTITGTVHVPTGEQLILGDTPTAQGWPKVVQEADLTQLTQLSGFAQGTIIFPYSIRLDPGAPGVLQRNWSLFSTSPAKHRAYAVQWFAMAAALLLLYFYASLRNRHVDLL